MKLNISENQVLKLFIENKITLENIDDKDREVFINNNVDKLLLDAFINKNYKQLENLFSNKQIKSLFIKEIKLFNNLAELNHINKFPENNIISYFIEEMTRQNFEEKKCFFEKIVYLIFENKEEMTNFFKIKINESKVSFQGGQPIGLFILRVINNKIEELLKEEIISVDLYNPITKDTIAHLLYQYSFENNKIIIDTFKDLNILLKDKNNAGKTSLDNLSSDLREKNIKTIEYLFSEKLDILLYKNELINYIVKCSNILRNKQTKSSTKDRAFQSLDRIFNLSDLQSNEILKEAIAKNVSQKCSPEIQYLWLSAKLPKKNNVEKKFKI